jgi:hypothetical protein
MGTSFDQIARDPDLGVAVFRRGRAATPRAAIPCAVPAPHLTDGVQRWQRPPKCGGAAAVFGIADGDTSGIATARRAPQDLRQNLNFRRLSERVWHLGPRPTAELLLELIEHHGIEADVGARLEKFAELEPYVAAMPEARDSPPTPVWRVA